MLIIRKIGKTLRGQAKPYQIVSAAILGSLIGFAPPFGNAPLYLIGVILLLAILNANFFIATFTAGIAKLLALALMPLSFELGLILVDGPLQGLFKALINAPITALMGFDYYVTAGGTAIALILGTLIGFGYVKFISSFRKKMANVEADSEKYNDFVSKRGVRIMMWVLFGGKAKQSYAELTEQKKIGNPIRPLGVVFAVLLVALLFVVQQFFSGPLLTTLLKGQLEAFHGATVDVEGVELDLANGQLTVDQLAMADPDNLDTDLIRANQVKAKVSTADLLRKRIVIDTIVIDDAVQGAKRDRPGVLIGKRPKPSVPEDAKTIEDWFAEAKVWKERLDTFRYWLEKLRGSSEEGAADEEEKDRLRRWADLYGHADVRAAHLVEGTPTVLVKDTKINKLRATWPDDETLNIHATNLSTHPALAPDKPHITVKSSEQTFDMDIAIAPRAKPDLQSGLKLTLRNQSIDETMESFELPNNVTLQGGTWQTGINGGWSDLDGLDLPMTIVLLNTNFVLGSTKAQVGQFPIEFGITGQLDNPELTWDTDKVLASMKQVGGQLVTNYLKNAGTDALKEAIDEGLGKDVGGAIEGLLGGDKKNNDKEDDEDASGDGIGDRVREGLDGFLNGDKKDD